MKVKTEAEESLVNYCVTIWNTLSEKKLQDKFGVGDKEKVVAVIEETLDWLDKNQMADRVRFWPSRRSWLK